MWRLYDKTSHRTVENQCACSRVEVGSKSDDPFHLFVPLYRSQRNHLIQAALESMSRQQTRPLLGEVGAVTTGNATSHLQLQMAREILEYVCRRGMNAGNHLTELELVEEFQVSRSPIRGALSYLAVKGIVEQRPNRGFFLKVNSHDLVLEEMELPRTSEEKLIISIANDLFENRVPRSFSEAAFRRRYDLGRMAASRILLKLSEDGVISRNRGHGWQFESTPNTRATHSESYAFRMVVEPAAILSFAFELDHDLAEMSRRHHETALRLWPEATSLSTLTNIDSAFHRLIGISSRNRFFLAVIERQSALRRVMEYASCDKNRFLESCTQHLEILSALERDDREEAAELMRRHLETAREVTRWRCLDGAG